MIYLNPDSVLVGERGQYRVISLIGEGGMACVYSASSALINVVAVKVLHDDFAIVRSSPPTTPGSSGRGSQTVKTRFFREAKLLERLGHPHLAGFIDTGFIDAGEGIPPVPFIVSDFVDGQPLDLVIQERARELRILKCGMSEAGALYERLATPSEVPAHLSEPFFKISRFIPIARALGSVLSYIHQEGIVHRDIKPDNVMIRLVDDHVEVVKLLDLGIAWMSKAIQLEIGSETTLTRESVIGTPFFMPPEQCLGGTDVKPTFDVFSFGMVLYIMLTGRHPNRDALTLPAYYVGAEKTSPFDPALLADGIHEEFRQLVIRATQPDPQKRYQSAFEMLQVINRVESSLLDARSGAVPTRTIESEPPVPTIPGSPRVPAEMVQDTVRPRKPGGAAAWVIGITAVALIGGAFWFSQTLSRWNAASASRPASTAQSVVGRTGIPSRTNFVGSPATASRDVSPDMDTSPQTLETVRRLCVTAHNRQGKGLPANVTTVQARRFAAAFAQVPECRGL